jgi:hypothetical protein
VRLHPVNDGLIPGSDERTLIRRDRAGNPLIDVVDPTTGFCIGVRSNLTFRDGESVLTPKSPSGGSGVDTRFDSESARYYDYVRKSDSDPVGIVVRLESDGDGRLPCSRVRVVKATPSLSRESERKSSAPVQKALSTRKDNDSAVKSVLSAMGYKGPITKEIRRATLEMIQMERSVSGL